MNREQIMELTDEELRIKAAELAGWHRKPGSLTHKDADATAWPWNSGDKWRSPLLDYPHDIAAAFELESAAVDQRAYAKALNDIMFPLDGDVRVQLFYGAIECDYAADGELLPYTYAHASPRDRTRAFVLAMTQGDKGGENRQRIAEHNQAARCSSCIQTERMLYTSLLQLNYIQYLWRDNLTKEGRRCDSRINCVENCRNFGTGKRD